MNNSIDLNADLGEGGEHDAELIPFLSSASIACGAHAGDPRTMGEALRLCKLHGVTAGAHPGFADREYFGRRHLNLSKLELTAVITGQLNTIREMANRHDAPIRYVKLHGALANMTATNEALALTAYQAVAAFDRDLVILVMENSAQESAAGTAGLEWVAEAYADRAYGANGLLAPRSTAGAVLTSINEVVERCRRLASAGEIVALDGSVLKSQARSICVHGDTPGAMAMVAAIRAALTGQKVEILPFV